MKRIGNCLMLMVLSCASAVAADPVAELKAFSDFKQVDLGRLLKGEVLTERGALMNFPNGISVQSCFAVPYPAAEVARRIQTWDPSQHKELKVFGFYTLHAPVELADFAALNLAGSPYPVRWLREKIAGTSATKSDLNLSRTEAQALADCVQKSTAATTVAPCFNKLLLGRASAFQRAGYIGGAAYDLEREPVLPRYQLQVMIREQDKIARAFRPILMQSGLFSGVNTNLTPVCYCSFFDANHKATVSLGAIYRLPVNDHFQILDTEYYVCASYYASAVLYQVWPIRVGDTTGALVWRGDFFAAPTLGVTKGTERIAYGALMVQQVKQSIRHLKEDLKPKK